MSFVSAINGISFLQKVHYEPYSQIFPVSGRSGSGSCNDRAERSDRYVKQLLRRGLNAYGCQVIDPLNRTCVRISQHAASSISVCSGQHHIVGYNVISQNIGWDAEIAGVVLPEFQKHIGLLKLCIQNSLKPSQVTCARVQIFITLNIILTKIRTRLNLDKHHWHPSWILQAMTYPKGNVYRLVFG